MTDTTDLQRRLDAAEAVCLLYGWSPAPGGDSDRTLATAQAWTEWHDLVGSDYIDAKRDDYSDDVIAGMAAVRRDTRDRTIRRIEAVLERGQ